MTTPVDSGTAPDYYNPAKDEAKLQAAMVDPLPFDGWPSRWKRCVAAEVLELRAALTAAEKRAQEADSDCEKALKERDEAVEMCDKLAARIADMDDLDIGEHSSGNCPWQNALDGISQEPT